MTPYKHCPAQADVARQVKHLTICSHVQTFVVEEQLPLFSLILVHSEQKCYLETSHASWLVLSSVIRNLIQACLVLTTQITYTDDMYGLGYSIELDSLT